MITLDFVGTLAAAGLVLFAGYGLQRRVGLLARYNIPAPVDRRAAGGARRSRSCGPHGHQPVAFDTTLQAPLMIAFFTSIGFGASVPLLRSGGPAVAVFLALATAVAVLQNLVGAAVAAGLGVPPLLGVLAGSVTLTGGPGHRPRLRPALRAGRGEGRGHPGGGLGHGGHRDAAGSSAARSAPS